MDTNRIMRPVLRQNEGLAGPMPPATHLGSQEDAHTYLHPHAHRSEHRRLGK